MHHPIITHALVGAVCIVLTWLICANNAKKAIALRDKARAEADEARAKFEDWKARQKTGS